MKNFYNAISSSGRVFTALLLIVAMCPVITTTATAAPSEEGAPDMQVEGYNTVRETRISRTEFDYEINVTVHNNETVDVSNVIATVTTIPASPITVLDGTLAFGDMEAGGIATAILKLRIDRSRAFSDSHLVFEFTGEKQ